MYRGRPRETLDDVPIQAPESTPNITIVRVQVPSARPGPPSPPATSRFPARSRTIIRFPESRSGDVPERIGEKAPQTRRNTSPRPRSRTNLRLQGPEQAPNTASSPRTGCVVLFYRILLILHYILCLMFNNVYIWCYVSHARLSQTLVFRQFCRDLIFCLRCDIFLDNVLLVDK